MAQLVARLVRNEKVRGSNPLSSTKMLKPQVYPGASTFYKLRDSNPGGLARGGCERGLSVRPRQWFSEAVLRKPLLVRSTAESP